MHNHTFHALIVDDDVIVGKKVAEALEQEGFSCELAVNGDEARARLAAATYGLLVTELRMARKHGYSLVLEVLERNAGIVVVIHTRVDIPRLTKDLMARGVDDILFKPMNYASLAAKIKGRVVGRLLYGPRAEKPSVSADTGLLPPIFSSSSSIGCLDFRGLVDVRHAEADLDSFADFLQGSSTLIDVLMMISTNETNATSIAQEIKGDLALADELIRLANGSMLNSSRRRISTIEEAVARIGTSRICEIITDHLTVLAPVEA